MALDQFGNVEVVTEQPASGEVKKRIHPRTLKRRQEEQAEQDKLWATNYTACWRARLEHGEAVVAAALARHSIKANAEHAEREAKDRAEREALNRLMPPHLFEAASTGNGDPHLLKVISNWLTEHGIPEVRGLLHDPVTERFLWYLGNKAPLQELLDAQPPARGYTESEARALHNLQQLAEEPTPEPPPAALVNPAPAEDNDPTPPRFEKWNIMHRLFGRKTP